jgi:bifunctional DNase/RNase
MPTATRHRFVDMRIADILEAPAPPGCYIVVLEERGGRRRLLIWIARAEATAMALRLAGMGLPARPLAGDLAAALVEALGGRLAEVRIDRLDQGTFYATVALEARRGRSRSTPAQRRPQPGSGRRDAGPGGRRRAGPGGRGGPRRAAAAPAGTGRGRVAGSAGARGAAVHRVNVGRGRPLRSRPAPAGRPGRPRCGRAGARAPRPATAAP